jgi:hypothetical protein
MTLKIYRVKPGVYSTSFNGTAYVISLFGSEWVAHRDDKRIVAKGATKKEVVSRLEILARSTKDRAKYDAHKIAGRKVLTPGVELTMVAGSVTKLRGRVRFLGYTRTNDGKEWIDVVDSHGKSRAVDPAKIKTVHRDRKMR